MASAIETLVTIGVLPVVTLDNPAMAIPVAEALLEADLPSIEVAFRTPEALACLRAMTSVSADLLVGAGTILTVKQVDEAVAAGAMFVVSPGLDSEVVARCQEIGVTVLPGVATATDIQRARRLGIEVVKLFPAEPLGGLRYLSALSEPFPDTRFVPTGGIGPGIVDLYLRHPAVAAVGGSWIAPRESIANQHFSEITKLAAEAVAIVARVRG